MDCILPSFSVHEILQARILECVVISFSGAPVVEIRIGRSSRSEPPGRVHYQSIPLLCKALLPARLFNCEPFSGHWSFDLNIFNMRPKDLSFGIDEIFPFL